MEQYLQYAPTIIVVFGFFIAYKIFVTPEDLSKTTKEINDRVDEKLEKLENKTASKEAVINLTAEISDMKKKIDKIYDFILGVKL